MSDPRDCPHGVQFTKRLSLCGPCMETAMDAAIGRAQLAESALRLALANRPTALIEMVPVELDVYHARGVAFERARVVAWLRGMHSTLEADQIERGEHMK
jgi:hypothetical protein